MTRQSSIASMKNREEFIKLVDSLVKSIFQGKTEPLLLTPDDIYKSLGICTGVNTRKAYILRPKATVNIKRELEYIVLNKVAYMYDPYTSKIFDCKTLEPLGMYDEESECLKLC